MSVSITAPTTDGSWDAYATISLYKQIRSSDQLVFEKEITTQLAGSWQGPGSLALGEHVHTDSNRAAGSRLPHARLEMRSRSMNGDGTLDIVECGVKQPLKVFFNFMDSGCLGGGDQTNLCKHTFTDFGNKYVSSTDATGSVQPLNSDEFNTFTDLAVGEYACRG